MDKIGKRMPELLADPQVSATQALAVMWKEIGDYEAACEAQFRARYEDVEDDYDEYSDDDDDDSEENEETEAGGGEAGDWRRRPGGDEKEKNRRVEEEAPRILLCRS
ncbi:uncharacterized protein [Triticum aestivum]|uniref:uncharacterized protein n=1 Tax=Triticum aestivum TaxID=4565 RepID=UPI001D033834|nr:uncharacterized protein LOC123166915 [Triticum aestivum]